MQNIATDIAKRSRQMPRPIMVTLFIILGTLLLSSQRSMAFTLGVDAFSAGETSMAPGTQASDIPTPQLLRVRVDRKSATLGIISPTDSFSMPQPPLQLRKRSVAPATGTPIPTQHASQQVAQPKTAYQLNGAELLLLRKTRIVAERETD